MSALGPRRTTRLLGVAAALLVGLLAVLPASGASADTASDQREVKRRKAEVAAQVDTLQATDAQLAAALADLQANVSATQAAMNNAQDQIDAATARAERAERDAAAAQAQIEALRRQVVAAAVEAYVDPQSDRALDVFRETSANDASTKQALIAATSGAKLDVVDEFRSEKQRLDDLRAEADAARAEAARQRDTLTQTKAGYDAALSQQQRVSAEVGSRISDKLAESAALTALDSKLSAQLQQEQAALAARVKVAAESGGGGAGGAGGTGSSGGGTTPVITRPGLSTVRGITVATSIAGRLASMLDAAAADGIVLGGSGFRDPASQVALRRAHCGTSNYAIYQMPPDQCSPPTAIPGRSKHEQGLAIDFTVNGRAIESHAEAAFQWLAAHAGSYGFANLPSEPWHWSVDGS